MVPASRSHERDLELTDRPKRGRLCLVADRRTAVTRRLIAPFLPALVLIAGILATPTHAAAPVGGAIVRVNQDATFALQSETTIAINPTNPRNLVAGSIDAQFDAGQCAAYSSTDRGKTWLHQILPTAPGFATGGDPIVAFGADGTAFYLCMDVAPGIGRTQYVYRSTDGGRTWGPPVLAMGSPPATDDDKGFLAVDDHPGSPFQGNVYAVATRAPCGPATLRFSRSVNGASSFQADRQVNDSADIAFAGNIAVGVDGAVYVAWGRYTACGPNQVGTAIMLDKSTDGGLTFGALAGGSDRPIRLSDILIHTRPYFDRGNGLPVLGTHPTDPDVVYAVWGENPPGLDDSDVVFSRSLDGGNTWSAPIRVNDDANPPGEFHSQFHPTMSVDPVDGEIDIVWYSDERDPDRNDAAPLVDVYFASSTDGGTSFGPSTRLTTWSSLRNGFFGDYIGIDSFDGTAHPIWTDTNLGGGADVATTRVGALLGSACTLVGTAGNDGIDGTSQRDVICALDGDDTVRGGGGNDTLGGGPGDDILIGGPGRDRFIGGPGKDRCQQDPDDRLIRCA
jgi:hypothetical protein